MSDYSTNVVFRLSVEGEASLEQLRGYMKQMEAVLKAAEEGANNAAAGLGTLHKQAAAVGNSLSPLGGLATSLASGLGEVSKQGQEAAQSLTQMASAAKSAMTSTANIARTGAGVISGGGAANIDPITGLPSAAYLRQRLEENQALYKRQQEQGLAGWTASETVHDWAAQEQWANMVQQREIAQEARNVGLAQGRADWARVQNEGLAGWSEYDTVPDTGSHAAWEDLVNRREAAQAAATAKGPGLMKTFAAGAEKATMDVWGVRRIAFDLQQFGQAAMQSGERFFSGAMQLIDGFTAINEVITRSSATMRLPAQLFDELQQGVYDAAIATAKFSPDEVASGLQQWAAGTGQVISTESQLNDILADTTNIQKLAAMNGVELGTTMAGVGGIMTSYGLSLDKVSHVTAVLNYTAQESFANVDDLGEAFTFVGPLAAQMGISFEETAAALALLSDANIKGSMAGRAFRQMLMGLADPTASVDKAMTNLLKPMLQVGQTWEDIVWENGEFIGLPEYIDTLAASVENLTSAEQVQALAELATANALPGLITLVRDQAEARKQGVNIISVYSKILNNTVDSEVLTYKRWYEETTGYMFSTEGAMARFNNQWEQYIKSPAGEMDRIRQEWSVALLKMGEALTDRFLPALTEGVNAFAKLADFIADNSWILTGIAALKLLETGLGAVTFAAGNLIQMWALLKTVQGGMASVSAAGGVAAAVANTSAAAAVALAPAVLPVAVTAGLVATTAYMASAQKRAAEEQVKAIEEVRADAGRAARVRFDEWFKQETIVTPGVEGMSDWVESYVPKSKEAAGVMQLMLGHAKSFEATEENVALIMGYINSHLSDSDRWLNTLVVDAASLENQLADVEERGRWLNGEQFHDPAVRRVAGISLDDDQQQSVIEAQLDYQQKLLTITSEYGNRREELETQYNESIVSADKSYYQQREQAAQSYALQQQRTLEDNALQDQRTWEDYQESRQKILEDAQESAEKATRDHLERLRELERDHNNRMVDLLEERDVQGLTKEIRSYSDSRSDLESSFATSRADSAASIQKQLDDAQAAFEKQAQREQENRARSAERAAQDYAIQLAQAAAAHAEQLAEMQDSYNKRMEELDKQEKEEKETAQANLLETIADISGLKDRLTNLLTDQMLEDTMTWFSKYTAIWKTNILEIISFIDAMRLFDNQYEQDPSNYGGEYAGGAVPSIAGARAFGGYVNNGLYKMHGGEFVLNRDTTRDWETRYGALSQSTFMNAGDTYTFSPVLQGVGTADRGWLLPTLDKWWREKQLDIRNQRR